MPSVKKLKNNSRHLILKNRVFASKNLTKNKGLMQFFYKPPPRRSIISASPTPPDRKSKLLFEKINFCRTPSPFLCLKDIEAFIGKSKGNLPNSFHSKFGLSGT